MKRLMDYKCKECGFVFEDYLEVGELPPICASCSGSCLEEIWCKPADIRTSDQASYLDGTNPGMKELRKSMDIQSKMYEVRPSDRKEYMKEIKALRKGKHS